jgi:hypothetical protein
LTNPGPLQKPNFADSPSAFEIFGAQVLDFPWVGFLKRL